MAMSQVAHAPSRLATLIVAFMLVVAGCNVFESGSDDAWPEWPASLTNTHITPTPYDTEELLRHGEILPLPDVTLTFSVGEDIYCDDYSRLCVALAVTTSDNVGGTWFLADAGSDGSNLFVRFTGLYRSEGELALSSPPRWQTELQITEGTHRLTFDYGGQIDRYVISMDAAYITIDTRRSDHVLSPDFTEFFRSPPNSFALYAAGTETAPAESFVNGTVERHALSEFSLPPERDGLATGYRRIAFPPSERRPAVMEGRFLITDDAAEYGAVVAEWEAFALTMRQTDPRFVVFATDWLGE
jgi:hypothetical protein